MKTTLFLLTLHFLSPMPSIHSMQEQKTPLMAPDELSPDSSLPQIIIYGEEEELETFLEQNKKTYWDALEVCAHQDSANMVEYILSKIVVKKPSTPEKLLKYFEKEDDHYMSWVCSCLPTSCYLWTLPSCPSDVIQTICMPCVVFADVVRWLGASKMNTEEKNLYSIHLKEMENYKTVKENCMKIREKAFKEQSLIFVQAFDRYRTKRKFDSVEKAFK